MIEAFCCIEADTLPQLTVAVSSFQRHNPGVPVRGYCKSGTDVEPLLKLGVIIEPLMFSNVMMAALNHLVYQTETARAVHIGAATLTKDRLHDLAQVDMTNVSVAVSGYWAFHLAPEYHGWYLVEDAAGETRRNKISPRYFGIDFMMFNLEHLRTLPRFDFLMDFMKSRLTSEVDFLNLRFRDDNHINMPGNLNVATEAVITPYLPTRELLDHRSRMIHSRVARFPGEIVPWRRYSNFDRVSMQLPMEEYAEAARYVANLIPDDFLSDIEANREKSARYMGELSTAFAELQSITTELA